MPRLIIADDGMQKKLGKADEPVMICTEDGTVFGDFTPATPAHKLKLQPQISEEEMARRMADTTSPGDTTEEIIGYLKSLKRGERGIASAGA